VSPVHAGIPTDRKENLEIVIKWFAPYIEPRLTFPHVLTDLRTQALTRPAPNAPEEVATVENMTKHVSKAAPAMPFALTLLCASPATDLRTSRVRGDVRVDLAWGEATAIQGKRVRVTAPTAGMGHVVAFGAGYVPGSWTWSPPI